MGVGVGPRKVVELRRAFRRLEPENMFRAPRAEGEPIWAYWRVGRGAGRGKVQPPRPPGKRAITNEGFVLVPAKELAEVRALEASLRRERNVLKAHCLLALNEGEVCASCWYRSSALKFYLSRETLFPIAENKRIALRTIIRADVSCKPRLGVLVSGLEAGRKCGAGNGRWLCHGLPQRTVVSGSFHASGTLAVS